MAILRAANKSLSILPVVTFIEVNSFDTGRWEFDKIDKDRARAESYLNPIKAFEDFKGYEDLILKGLLLNNFLIKGADYSDFEEILKVKKELGVELKTL